MLVTDQSAETIEEGLNEVFYQAYGAKPVPGLATLEDVFNTAPTSKHSEYDLRISGVGEFPAKGEPQNIPEDYEEEKYKTTYSYVEYSNSVPVSYAYLNDQLYSIVRDKIARLGIAARHTQYKNAFRIFTRANNAAYTGADGVQLVDGAHPTETAGTQSNVVSTDLTLPGLETGITTLNQQVDDRGILIPQTPSILLVATKKFGLATQITKSTKVYDSANNSINWISDIYPTLRILHTPYIGAKLGGDDDNWFILSDVHKIKRFIRFPLMTWMNSFKESRSMTTYYNAHFGESTGWSDYLGIVGGNADWS